ncbi:putative toxin-antitoxin system toxin component, PIN family [Rubrivirga sp.]|uniref:putative toxin-antitoxin system toxin component, PIN family n=1 Tax=Rubrivirga sp. TaxID=1885344 RepID=UPI003B516421
MGETRVVLDTDVLISAGITPHGVSMRVLQWVLDHGTLLASPGTLEEFGDRFVGRTKFDRYLSSASRRLFVAEVSAASTLVHVTSRLAVCSDPDDDRVVELAVDGRADVLVTATGATSPRLSRAPPSSRRPRSWLGTSRASRARPLHRAIVTRCDWRTVSPTARTT